MLPEVVACKRISLPCNDTCALFVHLLRRMLSRLLSSVLTLFSFCVKMNNTIINYAGLVGVVTQMPVVKRRAGAGVK